jgi:hypothetical protein
VGQPGVRRRDRHHAQIVAVNGEAYSADAIKAALTAAKASTAPIELLVKRGDRYLTVPVDYHGGLRWPWLEAGGGGRTGPRPPARATRPVTAARTRAKPTV